MTNIRLLPFNSHFGAKIIKIEPLSGPVARMEGTRRRWRQSVVPESGQEQEERGN